MFHFFNSILMELFDLLSVALACLGLLPFVLFGAVSSTPEHDSEASNARIAALEHPGFIHTVFFWFKEGISEAEKARFVSELRKLRQIEDMYIAFDGEAAGTPREVVDNSYDYALVVHFKDKAAHDAYQVHPVHDQFVAAAKDLWTRVQVYDILPR